MEAEGEIRPPVVLGLWSAWTCCVSPTAVQRGACKEKRRFAAENMFLVFVVSHVLYPPAEGREVTGAVDLEADPVHQPQGEALLLGTTATVHRSFVILGGFKKSSDKSWPHIFFLFFPTLE